jgi:hypothetical protein
MTAFYNKKGVATWVPANKSRGMVGKKKLIVRGKQITWQLHKAGRLCHSFTATKSRPGIEPNVYYCMNIISPHEYHGSKYHERYEQKVTAASPYAKLWCTLRFGKRLKQGCREAISLWQCVWLCCNTG